MRITTEELAQRLGVDVAEVERLVAAGAIEPPMPGLFEPGDIHHVRLLLAFSRSGIPLDALVTAYRSGEVTFAFYDRLHPPVGPASPRSYRAFAGGQGDKAALLPRLFTAFGIAEPDPETHLSPDDETLIAELLDILVATGYPDLVLRAVRMFGLGAQRATDSSLSAYREAIEPVGSDMNPSLLPQRPLRAVGPLGTPVADARRLAHGPAHDTGDRHVQHSEHGTDARGGGVRRAAHGPARCRRLRRPDRLHAPDRGARRRGRGRPRAALGRGGGRIDRGARRPARQAPGRWGPAAVRRTEAGDRRHTGPP